MQPPGVSAFPSGSGSQIQAGPSSYTAPGPAWKSDELCTSNK